MFSYCLNNPVNYSNPSGESVLSELLVLLAQAVLDALADGVTGAAIDGICTFATGGSWEEVVDATVKGFRISFVCGLVDDLFPASKIVSCTLAFKDCWDSGAGWGKSMTAGAIALFTSYSFTGKGTSKNIARFVDAIFGLGGSLMSAGVTEAIIRNVSANEPQAATAMHWKALPPTQNGPGGFSGIFCQTAF